MSALHRAWLFDQAAAHEYRRQMRELDSYAHRKPVTQPAARAPRQQPVFNPADRKQP